MRSFGIVALLILLRGAVATGGMAGPTTLPTVMVGANVAASTDQVILAAPASSPSPNRIPPALWSGLSVIVLLGVRNFARIARALS